MTNRQKRERKSLPNISLNNRMEKKKEEKGKGLPHSLLYSRSRRNHKQRKGELTYIALNLTRKKKRKKKRGERFERAPLRLKKEEGRGKGGGRMSPISPMKNTGKKKTERSCGSSSTSSIPSTEEGDREGEKKKKGEGRAIRPQGVIGNHNRKGTLLSLTKKKK